MNPWGKKGSGNSGGSGKDGTKLEREHYEDIRKFMVGREWMVRKVTVMHGSMAGWPDVFAAHKLYGTRFIETKRPIKSKMTDDQRRVFADFQEHGVGIWVIETVHDYPLLFKPANWWMYAVPGFRP